MNLSVKSFFSKCEHVLIKFRICSHLLNKSLTKNFTFCVVNIIPVSLVSFYLSLIVSLSYTLHQSTLDTYYYPIFSSEINFWQVRKGENFQYRNYCTIINALLEHRTFFQFPLVEEVPRNL